MWLSLVSQDRVLMLGFIAFLTLKSPFLWTAFHRSTFMAGGPGVPPALPKHHLGNAWKGLRRKWSRSAKKNYMIGVDGTTPRRRERDLCLSLGSFSLLGVYEALVCCAGNTAVSHLFMSDMCAEYGKE